MKASLRSLLILPLILGAACATGSGSHGPPNSPVFPQSIQVAGAGRATAAPDSARVDIGVEAFSKSLARATEDANARMGQVLAVLREAEIPAEDVRTTRYDVFVERRHDDRGQPGEVTGFRVSTSAQVRIRELAKVGPILDKVVAAGSNQVHSLTLEKADPTADQARALGDAYKDARAKAEELARAAGVKLGKLVAVSESAASGPPVPYFRAEAMAKAAAPVATGELEFTASVLATFAIE